MLFVSVSMFQFKHADTKSAITFDPELGSSPNFDTTQPRPYTTSVGGTTIAL